MLVGMTSRPALLKLSLAALALVLALPASVMAATTTVVANASTWQAARVRIVRGDTVEWANRSFREHSVTAWGGNWTMDSPLVVGGSVSKRFRSLGRFKFRCRQHSQVTSGVCEGMCGVIRVSPPA